MIRLTFILNCLLFCNCGPRADQNLRSESLFANSFKKIGDISTPAGFKRTFCEKGSFGEWLRNIFLKNDSHVYLYNGSLKQNQSAQFAVLDISVGKKDMQQCADAVMRLRAEYLFHEKKFDEIAFSDNEGKKYQWAGGDDRAAFDHYLENVFGWCGTASLEKQMNQKTHYDKMEIGDVFIKGGFPGHAMIVVDIAINSEGKKVFMLAQSYMPAQDIHIVKNPLDEDLSPWYNVDSAEKIITPEFIFYRNQLKSW